MQAPSLNVKPGTRTCMYTLTYHRSVRKIVSIFELTLRYAIYNNIIVVGQYFKKETNRVQNTGCKENFREKKTLSEFILPILF